RGLIEGSPRRAVSIDAVANALKARGFHRPPGSPRLVTRLRRIRELMVSPSGTITLAEEGGATREEPREDQQPVVEDAGRFGGRPHEEPEEARQPAYLNQPEPERPEVDGTRAEPPPAPAGRGRRRRRRRWRGGQRQPVSGSP